MSYLEPVPASLLNAMRLRLRSGEEELIRVASDLTAECAFGSQWVIVTNRRVLVAPSADGSGIEEVFLSDVISARTETLVGGGCLRVESKSGAPLRVTYSAALGRSFDEVARGIEQLRKAEPLQLRGGPARLRCPRCGRLLPEKNDVCPACLSRWKVFIRIASYLRPYKARVAVLASASLFMTAAGLLPPMITRWVVDEVLAPKDARSWERRVELLALIVLGFFSVRLLSWGAEWIHGRTVAWLGARVTADIRSQLYRQLEILSLAYYDGHETGMLTSRVSSDAATLQEFLVRSLPYLVINIATLAGIFAVMFAMSPILAFAILLPVPAVGAWGFFFWRRMTALFERWQRANARFTSRLNQSVSSIRIVKAFGQEAQQAREFEGYSEELRDTNFHVSRNRAVLLATMGLITSCGMLTLWLFGGWKVIRGELTLGVVLSFYGYILLFYGPLQWFGQVSSWMTQAFTGARRIFEILDEPKEQYDGPDAVPMPAIEGRVTFRKVEFGYEPGCTVLRDIDLDVAPGEMIGVAGKSGAGKTTAMNLLCRFYDVAAGSIEIDGVDIRRIRLRDLREQIGIVPQEPLLFSGTIAENIGYGRPGASFAEIIEAGKAANAHEFILQKPDAYDSQVGERGCNLSGGERQRLAIARAILRDPRILILDEATSSVDVRSEKLIQEAIGRLARNRTSFVVAHRLSTIRNANRVMVLDGGRVVELGAHEDLMAQRGLFYTLVRLQQEPQEELAS
jgi:ATP-binding cassette subfamily B protein